MVATRFYLSATTAAAVSPAFHPSAWVRTSEADRREMNPTKDGSTLANKTAWGGASSGSQDTCLFRQFVSPPMGAGVEFTAGDAVKGVIRCLESATNDNIERLIVIPRVLSSDGSTARTTISTGILSPANEFATTLTNRKFSGALNGSYTTVDGDVLVLEVGARLISGGGSSITGTMNFGSSAGADLAEDETSTTANDPWFEINRECYPAPSTGQPTSKRFGGIPFMGAHGSGLQAPVRQWIRKGGVLVPQFATTQLWRPAHGIN